MRRSPVPVAVIVLAVLLFAVLGYALVGRNTGGNLDSQVQRGQLPADPASQVSLAVLGQASARQTLGSLRGEVVFVNVWGSWCDPCKSEAPLLSAVHDALQKTGEGQVLGVTHVDSSEDSLGFVKDFEVTYPSLRDVDDKLYEAFGASGTPETYVLDQQGRVAAISRGVITAKFANAALQAVGVTARVEANAGATA